MKKRYHYHVFYRYWKKNGGEGIGSVTHTTIDGILNIKKCAESIKQDDEEIEVVIITGYTKA